jgi:hypothetical protein
LDEELAVLLDEDETPELLLRPEDEDGVLLSITPLLQIWYAG